jgi:colanic acid/amylovoran biosynthesis protein
MKTYLVDIYLAFNLGDDMFLDHLAISFPDMRFVPFYAGHSYDTFFQQYKNVFKFPYGLLDKVYAKIGFSNKLQNYNLMSEKYDGLIFMGGGIFREESYWKSVYEYRENITNAFLRQNKTVRFVGCNFGPYQNKDFVSIYKSLFTNCSSVHFRDIKSYSLFKDVLSVSYAPDVLWDYKLPKSERKIKTLGISVIDSNHKCGLENYYKSYIESHKALIHNYLDDGYRIKLFSFCESEGDLKVCAEIAKIAPEQIEIHNYTGNIQKYLVEFGSCSEIIASRFHAIIIAMKFKIPVLPIVYGDKTRNLLQDLSFENAIIEFDNLKGIRKIAVQKYIEPHIDEFIKNSNQHFNFI